MNNKEIVIHTGDNIALATDGQLVNVTPMLQKHRRKISRYLATDRGRSVLETLEAMAKAGKIARGPAILSRPGRNGGTFVHRSMALDIAAWIEPGLQIALTEAMAKATEAQARLAAGIEVEHVQQLQLKAKTMAQIIRDQSENLKETGAALHTHRTLVSTKTLFSISDGAKALGVPVHTLFRILRERGHLVRDGISGHSPSAGMTKAGYMVLRVVERGNPERPHVIRVAMFTGSGLEWLTRNAEKIKVHAEILTDKNP